MVWFCGLFSVKRNLAPLPLRSLWGQRAGGVRGQAATATGGANFAIASAASFSSLLADERTRAI